MAQYLIITTVGTSIFSNFNEQKVRLAFERSREGKSVYGNGIPIQDFENAKADAYINKKVSLGEIEERIEDFWLKSIEKTSDEWNWKNDNTPNVYASAEISSILEIAKKICKEDPSAQIKVQLIATDTALSVSAAGLIMKYPFGDLISIQPFNPEEDYIPSLGVKPKEGDNPETYYDAGLQNLIDRLIKKKGLVKEAKKNGVTPVINFSGGYKAIIPILTIIAQLENISMYYIYEESDHLMEMGNLPINFDWAVVEALKPLLKNYILKEKLNQLAPFIRKNGVKFEGNRYSYNGADQQKINKKLFQVPTITHQAVHGLLSYKVIIAKNDESLEVTPLGKILSEVNIGDEKGLVMEHLLFKFFTLNNSGHHEDSLKGYHSTLPPVDLPFGFQVIDKGSGAIELVKNKPKSSNNSVREIGDIDIPLKQDNTFVWAESKAYSTACDYHSSIGKDEDYYFQLKARALSLKQHIDSIELLLLVFRFVFEGLNDNPFLGSSHFKKGLARFEELNEDQDIKDFASFRCLGITIPVDFSKDRIDLTKFYKGDFQNWTFEELKTLSNV